MRRKRLIELGKEVLDLPAANHDEILQAAQRVLENDELKKEVDIILDGTKKNVGWRADSWGKRYNSTLMIFNRLRRLELADNSLLVSCFTCDHKKAQRMRWDSTYSNCGHFVKATFRMTCFDRRNTRIQCVPCNQHKGGNYDEYFHHLELERKGSALELKEIVCGDARNYRHDLETLAALKVYFKIELATEGQDRGFAPRLY